MPRTLAKRPAPKSRRKLPTAPPTGLAAPPPGPNVLQIRQSMGLPQPEFARACGCSLRAVAGWEAGEPVTPAARKRLTEVQRLAQALSRLIPSRQLGHWLRSPQPAFDGQSPLHLIELGQSDRLWRMIWQIESGAAS